jgi:hypothetical protein
MAIPHTASSALGERRLYVGKRGSGGQRARCQASHVEQAVHATAVEPDPQTMLCRTDHDPVGRLFAKAVKSAHHRIGPQPRPHRRGETNHNVHTSHRGHGDTNLTHEQQQHRRVGYIELEMSARHRGRESDRPPA